MRAIISNLLRRLGILFYTDKIRFYIHYLKTYKQRRTFNNENPDVVLPSPHLMYESFQLDY